MLAGGTTEVIIFKKLKKKKSHNEKERGAKGGRRKEKKRKEEKRGEKRKKKRAHPDLNRGPIDLQSIALPLSYRPYEIAHYRDRTCDLRVISTALYRLS